MATPINISTIDRPYDNFLNRSESLEQSTASYDSGESTGEANTSGAGTDSQPSTDNGNVQQQTVKDTGSMGDIWVNTFIRSTNWKPKTQGFTIEGQNGYAEFSNVYVSGTIVASEGDIGGWIINATSITDIAGLVGLSSLVTGGDDIRFWAGNVTPASAPFYVTEAGVLKASSGTIGGNVLAATSISSTVFASGPLGAGWRIINDGSAEFQNVSIRGSIKTSVFEKDTVSAVNGLFMITKSDILSADMTALDASTLTISGESAFVANEVIRIKDGTNDEWMLVTNAASAPVYTVTRDLAGSYAPDTNPVWTKGTAVVSTGVGTGTKTGFITLDSSSSNSPFIDIYGRNSNTYTDYGQAITNLPNVRLGWLKGIVDASVGLNSTDVWGLYSSSVYLTGTINALSGYFGDLTNGITVASNGLLINGSGYIRTAASGSRVEIVKQIGGGFDEGIVLYDDSDNINFRVINGNPILTMNLAGGDTGVAQFLSAHTTTIFSNTKLTTAGANKAIEIITSGTEAGRDGQGGIDIANTATYGNSIRISHGTDSLGEMIYLSPNSKISKVIVAIANNGLTATHDARITNEAYLQFPAYYHCSDFDENLSGDTALASTVISNAYWVGGGTAGTQTQLVGSGQDMNSYIALSTTATASRSSTLTFGRFINSSAQGCFEIRFRVSDITNTAMKFGFFTDATHYAYFAFDTDVHATHIYFNSYDGGSAKSVYIGRSLNTSAWHTLRMHIGASDAHALYYDDEVVTMGTQDIPTSPMKPYVYVDNKAASEEKIIYVDYIKFWTGRDDTSNVS